MNPELEQAIIDSARSSGIPADVLAGMAGAESAWQTSPTFLSRHEQSVEYRIKGKTGGYAEWYTPDMREVRGRATSWGALHVMGYNLRDLGFEGEFVDLVKNPAAGIAWGAAYIREKLGTLIGTAEHPNARDSWEAVVNAYNTGGLKNWNEKHIARFREYRDRWNAEHTVESSPWAMLLLIGAIVIGLGIAFFI
jgi:hypothetical protein